MDLKKLPVKYESSPTSSKNALSGSTILTMRFIVENYLLQIIVKITPSLLHIIE